MSRTSECNGDDCDYMDYCPTSHRETFLIEDLNASVYWLQLSHGFGDLSVDGNFTIQVFCENDDDWDEIVLSEGHDIDQSQQGKYGDKRTLKSLMSHKVESTARNLREREDPFAAKVFGAQKGMIFVIDGHSPILSDGKHKNILNQH